MPHFAVHLLWNRIRPKCISHCDASPSGELLGRARSRGAAGSFARNLLALARTGVLLALLGGCASSENGSAEEATVFSVLIENRSEAAQPPSPIAPGVWVVHREGFPLFVPGEPEPGMGLEALAEDGDPVHLQSALASDWTVGGFDAGADAYDTGSASPGESFRFEVSAVPGERLSLAAMLVESNDLFIATPAEGIALFDESTPIEGELQVRVWDAGTEVDQPLGEGADQPLRQSGRDTGESEDGVVEEAEIVATDYVRVTVTPQ